MSNPSLKKRLLDSLIAVNVDTRDQAKIGLIIQAIENVTIPEKDYRHVADFILLLVCEKPIIIDLHPQNELLRQLYLDCLKHRKNIEELQTRIVSRRKN